MPEVDLTGIFNKTPEEIVEQFRAKGNRITWNWREMWQEAHSRAFTVAKATNPQVLSAIRNEVDSALADGTTFREFQKNLEPTLKKLGWWGRKTVTGPDGDQEVQLGSPYRLKTIYRTNLTTSYAAGRYNTQIAAAERRPWWIYRDAGDTNVRPSHRARSGTVLRYDHPWWQKNYPPNGWGCRCGVDSLSDRQLEARGLTPTEGRLEDIADPEWAYNPGKNSLEPLAPRLSDLTTILTVLDGSFSNKRPLADIPRTSLSPDDLLPPIRSSGQPAEFYVQKFLDEFDTEIGKPIVFTDVANDPIVISEAMFKNFKTGNWKLIRDREQYMVPLAKTIQDPDEIWLAFMQKENRKVLTRRYIKLFEMEGEDEPAYAVFDLIDGEFIPTTAFVPDRNKTDYIDRQRYGYLLYDKHQ